MRQAEERHRAILEAGGQVPILALAHYDLAWIYYEWNDLEKAWAHLEQGLEICTRTRNAEFQNAGHLLKAYLLLANGDTLHALAEVEISHTLSRDFNTATQARSMACHARIALVMADPAIASQCVKQMAEDVDAHSLYRYIGLIRPRLLLAEGKKAEAAEELAGRADQAKQAGWGYALIAILALQALAAKFRRGSPGVHH